VKLVVATFSAASVRADLLAVTVFEGGKSPQGEIPAAAHKALAAVIRSTSFNGKDGKSVLVPAPRGIGAGALLLVGLGREGRDLAEATRRAAGTTLTKAGELAARKVAFVPPDGPATLVLAAAEGFHLADYAFTRYKTSSSAKTAVSVMVHAPKISLAAAKKGLARVFAVASATKLARDLGNEPANIMTPARLAGAAEDVARLRRKDGVTCEVLDQAAIEKLGMGAYLAVGWGSANKPRFIHLTYVPKGAGKRRRVALVGKGLCFDSGGISIKPAANMEDMKYDMCGAAAVIALFSCLPDLGVAHEVHGYVAATENMPSGAAVRPGDIVTSMAGRTIEVINTDAEGRLTLVDAITYALRSKPDVVVDLATLTGACAVALGEATGIMANDDALRDALCDASDAVGERAWPLPLFEDYRSQLKSEHADVKNLGDRYGGALTAGLFLAEWVPRDLPWAHLDIAGSAWVGRDLACCPKGATGIGVRTLAAWLDTLK
jgi:leucyl aminopeptidase